MNKIHDNIPKLISSAFEGDRKLIEKNSLNLLRYIRKEDENVAKRISEIIGDYQSGVAYTRGKQKEIIPKDEDSLLYLAKEECVQDFDSEIFLAERHLEVIEDFLANREHSKILIEYGIKPSNSLLLYGPPGVGKTFLARYIAYKTQLPLITLDLSSTISSFLGKTGKNIREVINYAKSKPSILLLDEFDAIAKSRDDNTDLGELKRIVNVLLKELEDWPTTGLFLAATNHPSSLDNAIWRRFDSKIKIELPTKNERRTLWKYFVDTEILPIDSEFFDFLAENIVDVSPADIEQISLIAMRKQIISSGNIYSNLFNGIENYKGSFNIQTKKGFAQKLYKENFTQRDISLILDVSLSSVNRYINN